MKYIITIENLNFKYSDKQIFEHFYLSIEENTITTLVGLNGSGKSTLVKIILGLIKADGYIRIADNVLIKENVKKVRRDIGVVFENPDNQFVAETVKDDIAFSLENLNYRPKEIGAKIDKIAELLKIEHILEKEPHNLSGGEKQLVALASALINEPKILILDEAFTMVDYSIKERIYKIIKKYKKEHQLTVLNISHDMEDTLYGDRIVVIDDGKMIMNDTTKEVLKQEKKLVDLGLSLPFIADLSHKLRYYGLVDDIILDLDEMVDILWK